MRFVSQETFDKRYPVEKFPASTLTELEAPPTWLPLIDADEVKTPGISARIAAIGPPKITSLAHKNLQLVSFATSASQNDPTKTAVTNA